MEGVAPAKLPDQIRKEVTKQHEFHDVYINNIYIYTHTSHKQLKKISATKRTGRKQTIINLLKFRGGTISLRFQSSIATHPKPSTFQSRLSYNMLHIHQTILGTLGCDITSKSELVRFVFRWSSTFCSEDRSGNQCRSSSMVEL